MTLLAPRMTLRTPEPTPQVMTRRAWWLVALGFVLPGSAQVLAGNRRLGRLGLVATFTLVALALVGLALWTWQRQWLITIVGNSIGLLVLEVVVIAYAVLWLVLGLDTLRILRVPKVGRRLRAVVAGVALVATLVPVAVAGYAATIIDSSRNLVSNVFDFAGPPVDPIDGYYTFMLLGGDAGADREGLRPDSITVVSVDAETGAATMIGIPRNLQNAPFPEDSPMAAEWPNGFDCGTSDCMINAAYTYGEAHPDLYPDAEAQGSRPGIEATRDAVEGVLGITMQFYVIVDMNGFADLIDALGGITLDIEQDVPIAITGGPVEEWIYAGEDVHLDGYHALWYARSRADSDDYTRMERQRQVQQAIIEQFTPETLLSKYNQLAAAGQDMVETDIPQSMIGPLAELANETRTLPFTNLELVPPEVDTSYPDIAAIHQMVQDALAESSAIDPDDP